MSKAAGALFNSRKFWVGTFSVLGVGVAVLLRAFDKIPPDALVPTITAIAGLGATFMAATAAEDGATKIADSKKAVASAIHANALALTKASLRPVEADVKVDVKEEKSDTSNNQG